MPQEPKLTPDKVYVYEIIRRRKENSKEHREICLRVVDYEREPDHDLIPFLRSRPLSLADSKGTWRIYRTVNRRNVSKAMVHFTSKMVEELGKPWIGDTPKKRNVESLWRTVLLQPGNKAENKWLIDIDGSTSLFDEVFQILIAYGAPIVESGATPNGWYVITEKFDNRKFLEDVKGLPVEIKHDALQFIERFEI